MGRLFFIVALSMTSLAACVAVGTAAHTWITAGDKVACTANMFAFGCSTTLGWALSAGGAVIFAGVIYFWERFRGD